MQRPTQSWIAGIDKISSRLEIKQAAFVDIVLFTMAISQLHQTIDVDITIYVYMHQTYSAWMYLEQSQDKKK
jgi:hypothetical protein